MPTKKTEPQSGPPAAAGGVPALTVYLKREQLEGLGIDPDTLEVRIGVQGTRGAREATRRRRRCQIGGKRDEGTEAGWKASRGFLPALPIRGEVRELHG